MHIVHKKEETEFNSSKCGSGESNKKKQKQIKWTEIIRRV